MKKKLLYTTLFFVTFFIGSVSAQNGSLAIVATTITVEAGMKGTFQLNYTSDVSCRLDVELRITKVNSTDIDWDMGYEGMKVLNLPATKNAAPINFEFLFKIGQIPTEKLEAGRNYTFKYQLVDAPGQDGGNGFSELNGKEENIIQIIASTGVQNIVNITNVESTIAAGNDLQVEYNYTLAQEGMMKVEIRKFDGDNYMNDTGVKEEYINPVVATTSTPEVKSIVLAIPDNTVVSSELTGNENYKVVVTIYKGNWEWISEVKSDLTITAATLGIGYNAKKKLAFYPNPVKDVLMISSNDLENKAFTIVDMSGRTVKSINNAENSNTIDVSNLKNGIYIISTDNNEQFKFIKN